VALGAGPVATERNRDLPLRHIIIGRQRSLSAPGLSVACAGPRARGAKGAAP
jgi:hypothetical protein